MIRNLKRRSKITLLFFIILAIISNFCLLIIFNIYQLTPLYHDVDRRENGNTFVCQATFQEIIYHNRRVTEHIPVDPDNKDHKVFELSPKGEVLWELAGLAYPHEIVELSNEHILIADTGFDRVIEVNYPDKDIVWSWEPKEIDWSKVNPDWGDSDHYYNNPVTYDWTHLNHVDFKSYGSYNACIISMRNFNLIVEVNYTAEKIGPSNNPDNIFWYYGDYDDTSLLNMQHNPDYLDDGNIIVSDSGNNRILILEYPSGKILWEYDKGLLWPRDADLTEDDTILITDCLNSRLIEVDKETKEIVWKYKGDLVVPYEADRLENGNTLIGNGYGGVIYEVNKNGVVVWRYGISFIKSIVSLNVILSVSLIGCTVIFNIYDIKNDKLSLEKEIRKKRMLLIQAIFIIFLIFLFFNYTLIASWVSSIIIDSSPTP